MDPYQARELSADVFASWLERLAPLCATPVLVLACGMGDDPGKLHLCIREDPHFTEETVLLLLLEALKLLDARMSGPGRGARGASSGPLEC